MPSADIEVHKINLAGQESLRKALQSILGQQGKKQPLTNEQQQQPGRNQDGQQPFNADAPAGNFQKASAVRE